MIQGSNSATQFGRCSPTSPRRRLGPSVPRLAHLVDHSAEVNPRLRQIEPRITLAFFVKTNRRGIGVSAPDAGKHSEAASGAPACSRTRLPDAHRRTTPERMHWHIALVSGVSTNRTRITISAFRSRARVEPQGPGRETQTPDFEGALVLSELHSREPPVPGVVYCPYGLET